MAEVNPYMTALEICLQIEEMNLTDEQAEEVMVTVMAYFMRALVKNRMCFEKVISAVEHVYNQIT